MPKPTPVARREAVDGHADRVHDPFELRAQEHEARGDQRADHREGGLRASARASRA